MLSVVEAKSKCPCFSVVKLGGRGANCVTIKVFVGLLRLV